VCDAAERCTGASTVCPADAFAGPSVVCRTATDPCDVAESCTGASASCPADAFAGATTICRPAADLCDAPERCSGSSSLCPPDALAGATVECRPAASVCDAAERCTGAEASCPVDGFAPATVECRPSASACDAAERCSGSAALCPGDSAQPDGTLCLDALHCNGEERCVAGACAASAPVSCPARTICDDAESACVPLVAPEIASAPPTGGRCGAAYRYTPELLSAARAGAVSWTLEEGGEGASFDPATGTLEWTPPAIERGTRVFTLRATGEGGERVQRWRVTVDCSLSVGCGCQEASSTPLLLAVLLALRWIRPSRR
jgi:hypothetical protein